MSAEASRAAEAEAVRRQRAIEAARYAKVRRELAKLGVVAA